MAWQFDWPANNQGVVQAFRRPESTYESARFRLCGLDAAANYELLNADQETTTTISGRQLMETGLLLTLKDRPSAALITYNRREQRERR
jgi:alpha-galactosidase